MKIIHSFLCMHRLLYLLFNIYYLCTSFVFQSKYQLYHHSNYIYPLKVNSHLALFSFSTSHKYENLVNSFVKSSSNKKLNHIQLKVIL